MKKLCSRNGILGTRLWHIWNTNSSICCGGWGCSLRRSGHFIPPRGQILHYLFQMFDKLELAAKYGQREGGATSLMSPPVTFCSNLSVQGENLAAENGFAGLRPSVARGGVPDRHRPHRSHHFDCLASANPSRTPSRSQRGRGCQLPHRSHYLGGAGQGRQAHWARWGEPAAVLEEAPALGGAAMAVADGTLREGSAGGAEILAPKKKCKWKKPEGEGRPFPG